MTNKNHDKYASQQLRSLLQNIDELREKENEEKLRKELEKIKQMLIMYDECILKQNSSELRDTSDACFQVCLPGTSQEQPELEPIEGPENLQEEVSHKHDEGKHSKELTCMEERFKLSEDQCRAAVKQAEDIKQINSFLENENQKLLEELETMKTLADRPSKETHVVASQAAEIAQEITQWNLENPIPELIGELEKITEAEDPTQRSREGSGNEELDSSDCPFSPNNSELASPELYECENLEEANQVLHEMVTENTAKMVRLMIQVSEMQKPLLSLQIERTSLQKSFSEAQAQLRSETKSNVALRSKIQQLKEILEEQCRQSSRAQRCRRCVEEESSSPQVSSQEPQEKKNFWRRITGLCLCGQEG